MTVIYNNELTLLKEIEKQLLEPEANRKSQKLMTTKMIFLGLILQVISVVMYDNEISSFVATLVYSMVCGGILGVSIYLRYIISRSSYIEPHISLVSVQIRIKELET